MVPVLYSYIATHLKLISTKKLAIKINVVTKNYVASYVCKRPQWKTKMDGQGLCNVTADGNKILIIAAQTAK